MMISIVDMEKGRMTTMSRYSDLRWRIADLEKALEEEKALNNRLMKEVNRHWLEVRAKDATIEELNALLNKLTKKNGEN